MITVGVDAHKKMHVAVAVDEAGHELGEWSGTNNKKGWRSVLAWSETFGPERQWGIEGAWNYDRGLAQQLVTSGETVYEINTRWTALGRRWAKKLDKTDRLDARAVARFVRVEAPALPDGSRDENGRFRAPARNDLLTDCSPFTDYWASHEPPHELSTHDSTGIHTMYRCQTKPTGMKRNGRGNREMSAFERVPRTSIRR